MYTNFRKTLAILFVRVYNVFMTDKNRIQRENAVAEALLGPGKTARNLMRLLINAHEDGCGIGLEIFPYMGENVDSYHVLPRDTFVAPVAITQAAQPTAPELDGEGVTP